MDYSPVDLETGYAPPAVEDGTGPIATAYNKDRDLTQRAHALGPPIDYHYDSGGRLIVRTTPEGTQTYTYAGNTERIARIETPTGERIGYTYDGPLTLATRWSGTLKGSLGTEWNADFQIAAHVVSPDIRIGYGYDGDGLLTQAGDLTLARDPGHGAVTGTALGQVCSTTPDGAPPGSRRDCLLTGSSAESTTYATHSESDSTRPAYREVKKALLGTR